MQLQQLTPDFNTLDPIDQLAFVTGMTERRFIQLTTVIVKPKRKTSGTKKASGKKIAVSLDQLELLKTLGLV